MARIALHQHLFKALPLVCLLGLTGQNGSGCEHRKAPQRNGPAQNISRTTDTLGQDETHHNGNAPLKMDTIRLFGSGGERSPRVFARGETVELRALVTGLTARKGHIRLLASWLLMGPDRRVIEKRDDFAAVDQKVPKGKSPERIEASIRHILSPASPPGRYQARLRLVDAFSGKEVSGSVDLEVAAPSPSPTPGFSVQGLTPPPDLDLRAGLPLALDFELEGLTSRPIHSASAAPSWAVKAEGEAELLDGSGRSRLRLRKTLVEQTYFFPPFLVPLRWLIDLPADLPAGHYLLRLKVTDTQGDAQAKAEHRFRLLPGGLGIYALRTSGAGGVPRRSFLRGELMQVDLLLAGWSPPADLELDVGLVGPDGGFYLVRTGAHRARSVGHDPAHRPIAIPVIIPELAPTGRWTLKLRLRSSRDGHEASRETHFEVEGAPIAPLPSLQILEVRLRHGQDGAPLSSPLLRAGKSYHVDILVGGMRLAREDGLHHRAELRCTLRLRDPRGALLASREKACEANRRFSFVPLRLRLSAEWPLPMEAAGATRLEVEVLDLLTDRVSMLQRTVTVPKQR